MLEFVTAISAALRSHERFSTNNIYHFHRYIQQTYMVGHSALDKCPSVDCIHFYGVLCRPHHHLWHILGADICSIIQSPMEVGPPVSIEE